MIFIPPLVTNRVLYLFGCILLFVLIFDLSHYLETLFTTNIIQSKNDRRIYRHITLPNRLSCLLISDNETEESVASISVGVGSLEDPKSTPGLAHFLEHMLFLGSVKYPNQSEYKAYIKKNYGSYNAFTSVAKMLNDTTVLNTRENLNSDRSGGLELVLAGNLGSIGTMNLSASGFYQEIDASNLGYSSKKSDFSWTGSLNCTVNILKSLSFQVNSNYRSLRLTPQGESLPTYVVNFALRQELFEGKLALVGTISNAFNSFKRENDVATDILHQHTIYKRDSRILMLGATYNFGNTNKHRKDKTEFDSTE